MSRLRRAGQYVWGYFVWFVVATVITAIGLVALGYDPTQR